VVLAAILDEATEALCIAQEEIKGKGNEKEGEKRMNTYCSLCGAWTRCEAFADSTGQPCRNYRLRVHDTCRVHTGEEEIYCNEEKVLALKADMFNLLKGLKNLHSDLFNVGRESA